ncbi:MAG: hypothetical protein JNK57_20855 [Planctomycetaceae bacterium]|nr:hypothetical protein [Planctomycetaceae bacterium]
MYRDDELGHFDREYKGVILNNGHSRITITHRGSEKNAKSLTDLEIGDRVQISTNLENVRTNVLDAYWLTDIQLERLD